MIRILTLLLLRDHKYMFTCIHIRKLVCLISELVFVIGSTTDDLFYINFSVLNIVVFLELT